MIVATRENAIAACRVVEDELFAGRTIPLEDRMICRKFGGCESGPSKYGTRWLYNARLVVL